MTDRQGGLGHRIRTLRMANKLGLRELARRAEISPGFLSKIEDGGKMPTVGTIDRLARALDTTTSALVAAEERPDVRESGRAIAAVEKIPFRELALSAGRLVLDAARVPPRLGDVGAEHLLRAAVRGRIEQQVSDDEIERRADEFRASMPAVDPGAWEAHLRTWLLDTRQIRVEALPVRQRPALRGERAVLVGRPPRLLLLNPELSDEQRLFVLAREAGYVTCGLLEARSRVYPPDREHSFDQVFNDYRASYFAAALVVPSFELVEKLTTVLESLEWRPDAFERVLDSYRGLATDETVMYRFSQVMARRMPPLRTHFLKIVSPSAGAYRIDKRLNLSSENTVSGYGEHLCRRWLATTLVEEFRKKLDERAETAEKAETEGPLPEPGPKRIVQAQISRFPNSDEGYIGISIARSADEVSAVRYGAGAIVSVTVGFRISPNVKEAIQLLKDPNLRHRIVGAVCERCALQCLERAADSTQLQRDLELKALLDLD
jgi:XRE family transcriptional regulator, fatty acid utilization regulator